MIKKPLVLIDGEIAQLQPGDQLASNPNAFSAKNVDNFILPIGSPVCISVADGVVYAMADILPNAIGLIPAAIAIDVNGIVQTDGKLSALITEWDIVTGQTGGLIPGATYYLGKTGGLAILPPKIGFLVRLGIAINSTDLEIKISRPIKL